MFREFLRIFIVPLIINTKYIIYRIKLKKQYPNLKLSGKCHIKNSKFGRYNHIVNSVLTNCIMGDFSYVSNGSALRSCHIGKFTSIGPNVKIGLGEHPSKNFLSTHPIFYSKAAQVGITFADKNYFEEYSTTQIGNDVWIGANVIIKGGVSIEDGAIIASGAVVSKNVSAYTIVGGIPSKVIRMRFDIKDIKRLSELQWWDKDYEWLKINYLKFHSINNINSLI